MTQATRAKGTMGLGSSFVLGWVCCLAMGGDQGETLPAATEIAAPSANSAVGCGPAASSGRSTYTDRTPDPVEGPKWAPLPY